MRRAENYGSHRVGVLVAILCLCAKAASATSIASVFVTGHDPDFHAQSGNTVGAQNIIDDGLTFVRNGNTAPILLIESNLNNLGLGDHLNSENGLIASGYSAGTTAGNHYVKVDSTTFLAMSIADLEIYSAIFVPSDHGGTLTEADITALDARSADILTYLNAGGGLFAAAEDGFHSGGNSAALFGFLPFLATSAPLGEFENGNVLTPFGLGLGLSNFDINGNFSHNIFTATGGMNVVDRDASGEILSLAFQGQLTSGGVVSAVPEPGTIVLVGTGIVAVVRRRRAQGRRS